MDLVRAIAFLLAAGSALAAALALGGAINDKLDLFAQAAPAWLAGGLIAAIVLVLVSGARVGLGLAAFAFAASAALVAPDVIAGFTQRRVAPERQILKVIQMNVWDRNRDPVATANWLRDQKADIVILEELGDRSVPMRLADPYPFSTPCTPDCATVILSKVPPADVGIIDWPGLGPRHTGAWATFGAGADADAFTVAGTHYQWPIPPGPQRAQARKFMDALAPFDRQSLIIAGDFNLNPWSFGLRRQDHELKIPRITHAIFTWPAGPISHWRLHLPFPILAVDQIYAGTTWKVVSVSRGPLLGSDHYPIVAVLTR
jgi:endonuclease/exonuclease/phosphatase (EEP) superfamily protein YafD